MGDQTCNLQPEPEPSYRGRAVGNTEYSWCRAVPVGTGITVLALFLSKPPDISLLQSAFNNLQNSHAILRSKLRFESTSNTFSFVTPPTPQVEIQQFDLSSSADNTIDPYHLILERELNTNTWRDLDRSSNVQSNVLCSSVYTLSERKWALVLRLHTSSCDRAAAVTLLKELLELVSGRMEKQNEKEEEVSLQIEELIPSGKADKPFWARGVDMLGYSLNSFRFSNLNFVDIHSPRCSQVVRLRMSGDETDKLLAGCKSRGIKLSGALAAAGLIAAHSSKHHPDNQWEKYAVVTLVDCRSELDPVISNNHLGFYHSAILNTHDLRGDETLWGLAMRCYSSFTNAKNSNKHFTDMEDLNFLMCKAIDNPGLTPSSSMRTAFISVFEDPVTDDSNKLHGEIGLEDYVGCSSVHGVGPSIAVFDTIRDGRLDCACVYPSPLHSREQVQQLIENMKKILAEG